MDYTLPIDEANMILFVSQQMPEIEYITVVSDEAYRACKLDEQVIRLGPDIVRDFITTKKGKHYDYIAAVRNAGLNGETWFYASVRFKDHVLDHESIASIIAMMTNGKEGVWVG